MSENSKPDLILLHGAMGTLNQFDAIIPHLLSHYNVHTLNFSGHGGSEIPQDGFTLLQFETDVLNLLNTKKISNAHFFGYSMGGFIALSLAGKFPSRVISVFTLATKFNWTPETAAKEIKMLNPEVVQQKVPKFADILHQRHLPVDWKNLMLATSNFMVWLGNNPPDDNFYKSVTCPVRLGVGDKDAVAGVAETFSVLKTFNTASFLVIPDSQHPFETIPVERVAFEIKEFIERNENSFSK